jgi:hypothetical protein
LPSKKIKRQRLALASKPFDNFFFCIVRRETWTIRGTVGGWPVKGKTVWIQATSRDAESVELPDKIARDPDAFPDPKAGAPA